MESREKPATSGSTSGHGTSGSAAVATAAVAESSSSEPAPTATAASSTQASATGKRAHDGVHEESLSAKAPRASWFGAGGDGKQTSSAAADALKKSETAGVLASLKSKLSKPKDGLPKPKPTAAKLGLSEEERIREQQRHRERAEATGKPIPYYRRK